MLYGAPMRSTRAALCIAASMAFALTACSDGGDDLDPDAEEALIEDAILTEDDVPDGFVEGDPSDSDDDTLTECLEEADIDPDALDDSSVAEADPAAFDREGDDGFAAIEAEIRSVDPTGPAEDLLEAMGDEDFRDCVLDGFVDSAEEDDQEIEDPEIDEADVPVDADATGGLSFTGGVAGFDFEGQILVALVGNHVVSLELTTVNDEIDEDDVQEMFETMIERLEAD